MAPRLSAWRVIHPSIHSHAVLQLLIPLEATVAAGDEGTLHGALQIRAGVAGQRKVAGLLLVLASLARGDHVALVGGAALAARGAHGAHTAQQGVEAAGARWVDCRAGGQKASRQLATGGAARGSQGASGRCGFRVEHLPARAGRQGVHGSTLQALIVLGNAAASRKHDAVLLTLARVREALRSVSGGWVRRDGGRGTSQLTLRGGSGGGAAAAASHSPWHCTRKPWPAG